MHIMSGLLKHILPGFEPPIFSVVNLLFDLVSLFLVQESSGYYDGCSLGNYPENISSFLIS